MLPKVKVVRVRNYVSLVVLLGCVSFTPGVDADTYGTFQTARFYSANRRYLFVVTEKKRDWDECLRNAPPEEREKCWETAPHQRLRFSMSSGELVERVSLASR